MQPKQFVPEFGVPQIECRGTTDAADDCLAPVDGSEVQLRFYAPRHVVVSTGSHKRRTIVK